jgi:flagellar hook-associated protein 2
VRKALKTVPAALAGASLQTLSQIGITVQKDGSLALDSTKFANAVSSDLSGVANVLSAYGSAFKSATDYVVGTTGTIATRTDGINASMTTYDKQIDAINARLVQIEANYRQQFTALDTLMSSMTQTSTYLTQQLANLPKAGSLLSNN